MLSASDRELIQQSVEAAARLYLDGTARMDALKRRPHIDITDWRGHEGAIANASQTLAQAAGHIEVIADLLRTRAREAVEASRNPAPLADMAASILGMPKADAA